MHAPPYPPIRIYIYGTRGDFPWSERHWTNGWLFSGRGRPYHHLMDRKEGGDIYGAPNWLGVGVALAVVAITVIALVLELLD
jgi:hypothetical protein